MSNQKTAEYSNVLNHFSDLATATSQPGLKAAPKVEPSSADEDFSITQHDKPVKPKSKSISQFVPEKATGSSPVILPRVIKEKKQQTPKPQNSNRSQEMVDAMQNQIKASPSLLRKRPKVHHLLLLLPLF